VISDIQREVAVHLLANAIRRLRVRESERQPPSEESDGGARLLPARGATEEAYLRGMVDMLRSLYGPATADEMYRSARAFERSMSTR
jgi:hypothetical protein